MTKEAGLIIAHTDEANIPSGFLVCNGQAHTSQELFNAIGSWNVPDLTDKFIRGAGATPIRTVGGRKSAALTVGEMPNHNHGGTTISGEGGHSHASAAVDTGITGTLNHRHEGTSGSENANHTHSSPAITTGTVSAWHVHNVLVNDGDGDGDGGNYVDTNPNADGTSKPDVGVTNTVSVWEPHTSPSSATFYTGNASATHTHLMTIANASMDHTHAFTSGAPSAGHSHPINPVGGGTPIDLIPAHYAVIFLVSL